MKYLVLYTKYVSTGDYSQERVASYQTHDHKGSAIEFAVKNGGVIVEAFEFDIKKVKP